MWTLTNLLKERFTMRLTRGLVKTVAMLALLCVHIGAAQQPGFGVYTLRGHIILKSHVDTWAGFEAMVSLTDVATRQVVARTNTGDDGLFYLQGIPTGQYILGVSVRGKAVGEYPVDVTPNSSVIHATGRFLDLAPITLDVQ